MRNINRIQTICQRLAEVGFYTEDDKMIRMVESFVDKYAPKGE